MYNINSSFITIGGLVDEEIYGMAVMHHHPYVEHVGWRDQNGEFIMATSGIDASYKVNEDSTFTSVLKFKLFGDTNGTGIFPNGGLGGTEVRSFQVSYDGWQTRFSYDEVLEILGNPVPYDDTKHFVGFATEPDATEPDIIDGVTYLEDVYHFYVVWADNESADDPADEPAEDEEEETPETPDTGTKTMESGQKADTMDYVVLLTVILTVSVFGMMIRQARRKSV